MFLASLSLTGLWSGKRDVSHVEAAEEKLLDQPFIRVIGTGKVTVVPDEAVLTIGLLFRAFLKKSGRQTHGALTPRTGCCLARVTTKNDARR